MTFTNQQGLRCANATAAVPTPGGKRKGGGRGGGGGGGNSEEAEEPSLKKRKKKLEKEKHITCARDSVTG